MIIIIKKYNDNEKNNCEGKKKSNDNGGKMRIMMLEIMVMWS
jgi:hypothetical protein